MKADFKTVSLALAAAIVLVVGYNYMNTREHRTLGEKLDAAADHLDDGVDDAARELKDRTPAEKIKDAVDDARE
jgi:biopolymer transport protein ExbB/TolQ